MRGVPHPSFPHSFSFTLRRLCRIPMWFGAGDRACEATNPAHPASINSTRLLALIQYCQVRGHPRTMIGGDAAATLDDG